MYPTKKKKKLQIFPPSKLIRFKGLYFEMLYFYKDDFKFNNCQSTIQNGCYT